MDLLLHPRNDHDVHRPDPEGRLSTVGHAEAFKAFARMARDENVRFMVIGGTYRDVAIRASSTREHLPETAMRRARFEPSAEEPHVFRYRSGNRLVELQVAAIASTTGTGPFSVAWQNAETRTIEGEEVRVPRIEDYVILKLIAARADERRRTRDLSDVQFALEAHPGPALGVPAIRARLRDEYRIEDPQLRELVATFRSIPR